MVLTPKNSKLKNLVVAEAVKHGGEFTFWKCTIYDMSLHRLTHHHLSLSSTHSLNNFQPDGGCEWTGNRCKDAEPDDDRMPCDGRTSRKWCTNDFQPRSGDCEWRGSRNNGSCRTVEEDTPSPTPDPDDRMRCSGRTTKTWWYV